MPDILIFDGIAPAAESDCHWLKASSLQSGKQEAILARKGERLVLTGDIVHDRYMGRWKTHVIDHGRIDDLLISAVVSWGPDRLRSGDDGTTPERSRSKTIVASAVFC